MESKNKLQVSVSKISKGVWIKDPETSESVYVYFENNNRIITCYLKKRGVEFKKRTVRY